MTYGWLVGNKGIGIIHVCMYVCMYRLMFPYSVLTTSKRTAGIHSILMAIS